MESLLAEGNKKANANQNIRGKWDFCLKRLSTPTKTLPLLFETHTLTLDVEQKITNIQSTYHLFNTIILYFI
ncbi:hypothetical protein OUI_0465 [Helicobacter pylori R036d]|uniref:Uncharacterized protein n=1 Tax=Helicobacter pylori R036d TaxID=1145113 RepID=K2KZW6_HELPX|nr:hypothetical protein OUI_0465 [Helicobacter pylori R036d]